MKKTTRQEQGSVIARVLLSTSLVLLCGCGGGAMGTRGDGQSEPSGGLKAQAQLFFGNPLLSHVALSPDGKRVAAILAQGGTEVLIAREVAGGPLRALTKLERTRNRSSQTIRKVMWSGNDGLLVSIEMPSQKAVGVSARQTRLMSVRLAGGVPKYLGKNWQYQEYTQFQDQIISTLPEDPEAVLIGLWMPTQNGVGVRRLNVRSGTLRTIVRPRAGIERWYADHHHVVRAGIGRAKTGTEQSLYAREDEADDFELILRWDPFNPEDQGFSFAGFSVEPHILYVYRYTRQQRVGVYRYDLRSRELGDLVFADPEYDVSGLIYSHQDGRLLAIAINREKPEKHFIDQRAQDRERSLAKQLPDVIRRVVSSDEAGETLVYYTSSDVSPPRYFIYRTGSERVYPLFSAYPDLEELEFATMEPIKYQARDGLGISGYLTRPPNGVAPYPTIVLAHGGPSSRDQWGWNPEVQYLASLGFAVFQPNFRGSDGYGKKFKTMSYGEWGQAMQDDITDGTHWLIEQGIADSDRIGIFGSSYGGYAALWGLVTEPDLFRAGASYAGVTDIPRMLSRDQYYRGADVLKHLVGKRWTDRAKLRASSPARNADKIRVPVLLGHGTEDPTVHVSQLEVMADALEDEGISVEKHVYRGEYHGFLDERNKIDFYSHLGAFFQRHLMGNLDAAAEAR